MKVFELLENVEGQFTTTELANFTPEDTAELLENECGDFVEAFRLSKTPLLRGVKEQNSYSNVIYADIRSDRKPLYMNTHSHALINQAMVELNLKAHRGNSIFCTANKDTANSWGMTFSIFVQDGWTGTVFQKVKYGYVFDYISNTADDLVYNDTLQDSERISKIAEYLKTLKPHSFNTASELATVMNNAYDDILITGKRYYGVLAEGKTFFQEKVFKILLNK